MLAETKVLDANVYHDLLVQPAAGGETPLATVLKSGSVAGLHLYLTAVANSGIPSEQFDHCLLARTRKGVYGALSPLSAKLP
jgi:hypothetical protein